MPLKEERNREKEEIEKLLNLYGPIRIGFIPPFMVGWKSTGSISSYHQDVRNRQVVHYWPSWEDVVNSEGFVYPKTAREFREQIEEIYAKQLELAREYWRNGEYDKAVYCLPLGKKMKVLSFVNGLKHIKDVIMLRTCLRAQWEIRERYSRIAGYLKRFSGLDELKNLGPRCKVEGRCFEPKKEKCPFYERYVKS